MDVSPEDVSPEDHLLAAELATRAGLRLLALREEGHPPDELRTLGDTESNRYLVAALETSRPNDGLLSEESIDDLKRLTRRRVWIVDPLDGTREFGEAGRTHFRPRRAGRGRRGHRGRGGASRPDLLLSTAADRPEVPDRDPARPLRFVVSRSRAPPSRARCRTGWEPSSSSWAPPAPRRWPWCWARSTRTCTRGMYEWDTSAPVAVAAACGLHTSRLDGRALRYNGRTPWLPDLLICRPELAGPIMDAVAELADPADLADPDDPLDDRPGRPSVGD